MVTKRHRFVESGSRFCAQCLHPYNNTQVHFPEVYSESEEVIVLPENQIARANRIVREETEIVNTMVEAQRLADTVVEAAINWHKSDMDESMDAAQALEDAIEALIEFRRKMPIVKSRD